ncbi:condensin complex subunit 1-like isoform X2 [Hirundo rustica]|uniref:condensin complex subunit 1-like isoform X2 n=1 Tax=Hirundo rustica TaxID=43150 RepID=UPI001A952266|nr:condensin complex subunit 1-like isoform X2 [Hirundo rustica]
MHALHLLCRALSSALSPSLWRNSSPSGVWLTLASGESCLLLLSLSPQWGKAEMPGIHPDVWGTTWLCEKAGEGSRLPPEVRLVVYKLASKAKPALEKRSAPFGAAQKHLPFGRLSEAASASQAVPGSRHGVICHAHLPAGRRSRCVLPSCMCAVSKLWRSCRRLLSSKRGILHPESTRWRRQPPPFLPPQPVSPVGQVALQQVACLEASARAELGRRYLLKEEKSSKTCDSSIRQQRAPLVTCLYLPPERREGCEERGCCACHLSSTLLSAQSTRKEISFQEPWLLTVRLSSSAVLGSTSCLPSFHRWV